jgi:two-component system, LuxR family, response regulator FixJ
LLQSAGFVVDLYDSPSDLLQSIVPRSRSCVVTDVRMPEMSGLELQREFARRDIRVPVVFITGYGDVPLAVQAMKAGAIDFIEKPIDEELLLDGIRRALAISDQMWERVVAKSRIEVLSPREQEVFALLAAGITNAEISGRLDISPRTVEVHRANLYKKLEVKNLAAIVRLALAAEVIAPTAQPNS